jgi:hypothetical protein
MYSAFVEVSSAVASGDRSLITTINANADRRDNTTTLSTTTVVPDSLCGAASEMHASLARTHADAVETERSAKRAKTHDVRHMLSVLSERPDGCIVADSRWMEVTQDEAFEEERAKDAGRAQVYFIRVKGTKMVKVGFTTNINQRMITLQMANPGELELEFGFLTPKYKQYQKALHTHLQGKHVRGEWFGLEEDTDYFALIRDACDVS